MQVMQKVEGETPFTAWSNHEPSDLDEFLAPFGIHQGRGRHVLEAKGASGTPQVRRGLPPGVLHIQSTVNGGRAVAEGRTRVVLQLQGDNLTGKKGL